MISNHPFVGNLSDKSLEDLSENISTLSNRMAWAFKMGKHDMVKQMQLMLASYRDEYGRKQAELWNKHSGNAAGKIDIS
jgi:hypothetical protein